jgi:hypothetical protein
MSFLTSLKEAAKTQHPQLIKTTQGSIAIALDRTEKILVATAVKTIGLPMAIVEPQTDRLKCWFGEVLDSIDEAAEVVNRESAKLNKINAAKKQMLIGK